jgi:hypothetical protein
MDSNRRDGFGNRAMSEPIEEQAPTALDETRPKTVGDRGRAGQAPPLQGEM